jgi:hypothetical protein
MKYKAICKIGSLTLKTTISADNEKEARELVQYNLDSKIPTFYIRPKKDKQK